MRRIVLALMVSLTGAPLLGQSLPAPLTEADYKPVRLDEARLGGLLFYDPILSGNRNISCATCHHPAFATSDGLSLGIGEGGVGLGPARVVTAENTPEQRIPRHSTALFNLGAREFTVLFHDGRIEADPSRASGVRTPLDEDMVAGFASVLAAQTMFPVLSADEMAGHYGENEISRAVRQGLISGKGGAWDLIARRVAAIDPYARAFASVYDHIEAPEQIGFTDISNAIAAFVEFEWRSDDSPFDGYLRDERELPAEAMLGLALFYGEADCAACHSGPFQTDHKFHAMAAPQLGPGKATRFESHARDTGRMRVTGRDEDAYAFRTPSLRNVTRTAPYGHAGGHRDLAAFIRDHADVRGGLERFDRDQAVLPTFAAEDWRILDDPAETAAIIEARTRAVALDEARIEAIVAFLGALEDPVALGGRLGVPEAAPSGLPIDRVAGQ